MHSGNCVCSDCRDCIDFGGGLSGWRELFDAGTAAVQAEADRRGQVLGQSAHIDAQNDAVSDFETDALTPHRTGRISTAEAIRRIEKITDAFTAFCQRLGYARALAGARDVQVLADQLIADLEESENSGGVYTPGPGGGTVNLPGGLQLSPTTLALGGLALLVLMRTRK